MHKVVQMEKNGVRIGVRLYVRLSVRIVIRVNVIFLVRLCIIFGIRPRDILESELVSELVLDSMSEFGLTFEALNWCQH